MATSIELLIALPSGTTATVYLDPASVYLVEVHTDGTLAYVPADEVANLVLYETPEKDQWPLLNYVVVNVIRALPSDHEPDSGDLYFDSHPNPCACVTTTDASQFLRFTE